MEQLLRALVALALSHTNQSRHQRLVHRLRDQIDQQPRNQIGRKKRVHAVGSPVDVRNRDLLECGGHLDHDAGKRDRGRGAQNPAIHARTLVHARDLGKGKHEGAVGWLKRKSTAHRDRTDHADLSARVADSAAPNCANARMNDTGMRGGKEK